MRDTPVHLEPVKTDRGFSHLPPITDGYGSSVHVYESSAADGPHVWVKIREEQTTPRGGRTAEICAHLTMEELVKLGEQIEWMKQHHYQGACESAPKKSLWSRFTARLRSGDEE